jgi:hypothetical protein
MRCSQPLAGVRSRLIHSRTRSASGPPVYVRACQSLPFHDSHLTSRRDARCDLVALLPHPSGWRLYHALAAHSIRQRWLILFSLG